MDGDDIREPRTTADEVSLTLSAVSVFLEQAASLKHLRNFDEAKWKLQMAEHMAKRAIALQQTDPVHHLLLVKVYREAGDLDKADAVCSEILQSARWPIDEKLRNDVAGEQLLTGRLRAIRDHTMGADRLTDLIAYVCQNCGRLICYISLRCPYCRWAPSATEEAARSVLLSTTHVRLHDLLHIARGIRLGFPATKAFPSLEGTAREYLAKKTFRDGAEAILRLLNEKTIDDHFDYPSLTSCPACGKQGHNGFAETCSKCDAPLRFPPPLRLLICMNNLLRNVETSLYPAPAPDYATFVKFLAAMASNLLRNQESPTDAERSYALDLLAKTKALVEIEKRGYVVTTDPKKLFLSMAEGVEDARTLEFMLYIKCELEYLVSWMASERGLA